MIKIRHGNFPNSYILEIFGIRIKFRNKLKFTNNKIIKVDKNGKEKIFKPNPKKLSIKFLGGNSTIKIYEPIPKFNNASLICGENSKIEIGASKHRIENFVIVTKGSNCTVSIGKNFSVRGGCIVLDKANDISVTIGDECMFASNVSILPTDFHTITDHSTGKAINPPQNIEIGKHCWLCENATLLKGSKIPNDSIVARSALVTKKFCKPNTIIGGCPSKVLKENVNWDRRAYEDYLSNFLA